MAKQAQKKQRKSSRLAGAPLAEVVFEFRWGLHKGAGPIPGMAFDFEPMLFPLLHRFSERMRQIGFGHSQDFAHPLQTAPYGIVRRFRRSAESPFPLMQIGPGIFATNESARYEWQPFKAQVLNGLKALLSAYPTEYGFSIIPSYMELRYVDVFDRTILGSSALTEFAAKSTSLRLGPPEFLEEQGLFWGDTTGRLVLQRSLRAIKDTQFIMDVGNGQNAETKESVIQLMSRVITTGSGLPKMTTNKQFLSKVANWLELSHGITSPFFKAFIQPQIMKKFSGERSDVLH